MHNKENKEYKHQKQSKQSKQYKESMVDNHHKHLYTLNYMSVVSEKIHRLSPNQLRALRLIAISPKGTVDSSVSGREIGMVGKPLGGLFSSLSRQKFGSLRLIMPWGRPEAGKGLRWKLNTDLISQRELLELTNKLLNY